MLVDVVSAAAHPGVPKDMEREDLRAVSSRTPVSVEELHAAYGQYIFRFLLGSSRDRDLAETLTQETFLRAWTYLKDFRGEASPKTWLTRIALNLLRDHTRSSRVKFWRKAAQQSVDAHSAACADQTANPESSSEAQLIAREQLALVWETVGTFNERQRTVFLLRFVEELDLGEISKIMGIPMPTVKSLLYRGMATLRSRHQSSDRSIS